jgi:hypothetical protein
MPINEGEGVGLNASPSVGLEAGAGIVVRGEAEKGPAPALRAIGRRVR